MLKTTLSTNKLLLLLVISLLLTVNAEAATTISGGSFDNFYAAIVDWIQGSLGYVIALLGVIGTMIIYAFTHKGSVLFIGMLLSFFVGGAVGISRTMFDIGGSTFVTT